ncbi:Methyl-accepting chemotaxis protein III [Pseudooceanicola marinus]|uniref:Methyl-accepting chemotaxis protein III n=1 Tax=Pseudooceanicola marinus TaxID=396013 RepID=A0A1X6Y4J6_9RHOB|nr:methyl-accepting chemotaxis protein [Pseudooceanicola marinus]PJE33416.1 methyl-accepting chemotaxis protein [Pseudooceanicola marinus]SLN10105.1 Methyl-accepting chemotaxis protein III [Pseudooceanicola marinus]
MTGRKHDPAGAGPATPQPIAFHRTSFFRATAIVALCILLVVLTSQLMGMRHMTQSIRDWTGIRAVEATKGMSTSLAGAIKFGRPEAAQPVLDDFATNLGEDVLGALALRADGTSLASVGGDGFDMVAATALGRAAMEGGTALADEAAGLWAYPALYGGQGEPVGALVTQWTADPRIAQARRDWLSSAIFSLVVFAMALLLAAVLFYRNLSRPLQLVADQMNQVALGDLEVKVSGGNRGDEIGRIARRLERFRDNLRAARATQTENAFKSAGVSNSGSALVLLDNDQAIAFANPACERLLMSCAPAIRNSWPGFDPAKLAEHPAGRLPGLGAPLTDIRNGQKAVPCTLDLRWGEALISVYIDRVDDDEGTPIGYVLELKDISSEKLNEAVLKAIDRHQLRVDFDSAQRLTTCNARFLDLCGLALADLQGVLGPDLLHRIDVSEAERAESREKLHKGEALSGKFKLGRGQGEVYVEGSVSPLIDRNGEIERMVFIGSDITQSHVSMREAERERRETSEQQQLVVDALKVGLRKLADGDLTSSIRQPFRPEYEQLRSNFNQAVEALHEAMGAVVQNANSISGEAGEISNAADDLAQRTEKQAATLEQTAAALDELTASVKSAAAGADQASQIAATAQGKAETGGAVARQAVEAMDAIKSSSKEISKITSVIDDIAFQTNLLALNAGVEAARAGDAGRGFAVVATEVRALAQRSSEAAREINQLISASGGHVKSGVDLVDRTGDALGEIVTSVVDISKRVASIAASAREQATGLNEINAAVNDLDQVTQQNAAMFEETTAASHALTSEANALVEASARFRVDMPAPAGPRRRSRDGGGLAAKPAAQAAAGGETPTRRSSDRDVSWKEF